MSYEYDVFLSYTRKASAGEWVKRHFYPIFQDALDNSLPREATIFVDWQQETGISWPHNLERALARSRLMVAVLSPPYFRSAWCLAEWLSMCERHRTLGLAGSANPDALIHPVIFADGYHFPQEAKNLQHCDFRAWNYPAEVFKKSTRYLDFHTAVNDFAEAIASRLEQVPEWNPAWPIIRPPAPTDEPPTRLPRL